MRLTMKNGIITIHCIIGRSTVTMERIIFAKCQQENDTSGKLIPKSLKIVHYQS